MFVNMVCVCVGRHHMYAKDIVFAGTYGSMHDWKKGLMIKINFSIYAACSGTVNLISRQSSFLELYMFICTHTVVRCGQKYIC